MRRIKLTVAYDGTAYSGWQIQQNAPTVEAVLDAAIFRLTGEQTHVIGASRTDAGVHALGNVAVFDTNAAIPGERWAYAISRYLPPDVSVVESREVAFDFHPRHCNTVKTYEYQILCSRFPIPQMRNYVWHIQAQPDISIMRQAAGYLVGEHDFKSFCCVRTQAESTVRTVYGIEIMEQSGLLANGLQQSGLAWNSSMGEDICRMITLRISGNGFLYNMVRIIAGTLVQAGRGQISPQQVKEMLDAHDRTKGGQTAPPQGLTLVRIAYPDGEDAKKSKK